MYKGEMTLMPATKRQSSRKTTSPGSTTAIHASPATVDLLPAGPAVTAGAPAIQVMVVDDHNAVRSALAAFLLAYDDLEIFGEAVNGLEALRLCQHRQPDVILMDLVMPQMDGVSATRAIRARYPDTQVLVLTGSKEERMVQDALEAGAVGHWLKEITGEELVNAIRAAHHGHPAPLPEIVQHSVPDLVTE